MGTWIYIKILFLFAVTNVRSLRFGFRESDFTGNEGTSTVAVTVIKEDENVASFSLNISPLTYAQFANAGLLPPELNPDDFPDEAELDLLPGGRQDFDGTIIVVTFLPSTSNDEITINIPLVNDDIHEANTEGFLLLVTANTVDNDVNDESASSAIRFGAALVNIIDDDVLTLSFEMTEYDVTEGSGTIDDLVFVVKDIESELTLPVLVIANDAEAMNGSDYNFPSDFELVFGPQDSRLSISLITLEDQLIEDTEQYSLVLSVPPQQDYSLGSNSQAVVSIIDDDFGIIGFDRDVYTANEGDGFIDVCVVLIRPTDASLIPVLSLVAFSITSFDSTAEGNGIDFTDLDEQFQVLIPEIGNCFRIPINDDSSIEMTEEFTVEGALVDGVNGNFTFNPARTTVVIEDNDSDNNVTDAPPTDAPPTDPTTTVGFGGDPHFSVLLPTGLLLCYSVQGEHGFTFNLISNELFQMNGQFIPDGIREEVTWIGAMGIVVKGLKHKKLNKTKIRFVAEGEKIFIGDKIRLTAKEIGKIHIVDGKVTIAEREEAEGPVEVGIHLEDAGIEFTVRFVKGNHLDMIWKKVLKQSKSSHGLIGQFFRDGVEVDETRRLLELPNMEPVPVMRKPVWHFMEREIPEEQLCWVAMNPGYQGKRLIEGHYLDYLVDDVLSGDFVFRKK